MLTLGRFGLLKTSLGILLPLRLAFTLQAQPDHRGSSRPADARRPLGARDGVAERCVEKPTRWAGGGADGRRKVILVHNLNFGDAVEALTPDGVRLVCSPVGF